MPCIPYTAKGAVSGFLCIREANLKQKCFKCGRPAVCLCDFRDMEQLPPPLMGGKVHKARWVASLTTCDRPMCAECRTHFEPDEDYCELHSSEFSVFKSRQAEALYRKRCEEAGISFE